MIETQKLSLENKINQKPGLITSNMDGEKVMLSIVNGKYYNLGEIGGIIWSYLEKPIKIKQVILELTAVFNVQQEECENDVVAFLEHLLREGLIEVS